MKIRHLFAILALALAVLIPAAAAAQTQLTGQTSGGAYYNILVPDGWTPANGLVIWNHGFRFSPTGPEPDLGPLAALQLAEGYAVAASGYSLIGWSVFETVADNREMVDAFEAAFGAPQHILVYGASLGGIVTAQAIEVGNLGNVVGAMPICGAVAGSRMWDGGLDLRVIYDAVCGDVPGAAIPGSGLPFLPDPSFDQTGLALAVRACTGIPVPGLPDAPPTVEQAARLAKILAVTGLPASFLLTDMTFAAFGLADVLYDPRKLGGGMAFDNAHVDYGDPEINAAVQRVVADPAARRRLVDNYTPSGRVGDVKIVSLHTDKDGLVIVENENEYAAVVPPGNLTVGIVVEDVPSHCDFTEAETVGAWEALRAWVAGQPQPSAAVLQQTCQAIVFGGLAEGPCRIDPGFVVPDLDDRIRPRETCVPGPTTLCLGDGGRFRTEITWTDFQGNSGPGRTTNFATPDTGSFYFFDSDNIEMVVKALDGRQFNGRFWIFYGSLTNVGVEMTVTDTDNGLTKTYSNPLGSFASVGDTSAF